MDTAIVTNKRKRIVKKAALGFFIVVMLLTFFSKTINNLLMPEVEYTSYSKLCLVKEMGAVAEIKPLDIEKITAWSSMKITKVNVKEGDKVSKGIVLALSDAGDTSLTLKNMELEVKKAENAYESYKNQYETTEESGEDPNKKWLFKDLEEAQKRYDEAMELYENGLEEYKGVQACQKEIDIINEKIDAINKSTEETKKGREDYGRSLGEKEAELQLKRLELENLKKGISGNGEIKSTIDGVIYSVSAEKGLTYNNGQQLFEVIPNGVRCKMEWKLNTAKAELFKQGDAIEFEITGEEDTIFGTSISQRKYIPAEGVYLYTGYLNSKENKFKIGQAEINMKKTTDEYKMVLPNSAIFEVGGGKNIVFVLKQKSGVLGEEYYVKSNDVKVLDSNESNTAISGSLEEGDEVVSFTSKPLVDGARVKLR